MFFITAPLKFLIYFSLSFLILSFPIGNKNVFYHVERFVSPYTANMFSAIKNKTKDSIDTTKEISENLFSNTSKKHADKVQTKQAATSKKSRMLKRIRKERNHVKKHGHETYTAEEEAALKRILNGENI